MSIRCLITFSLIFAGHFSIAQTGVLKNQIQQELKGKKALVGISIIGNDFKDSININAAEQLPMQSVYKFPIALAVLGEVEKGKFQLHQKITITKKDLLPDTWSPIRDKFPNGTSMSIAEVIRYTVAESDNNGCDILLRLIGGTDRVERYLKAHNLKDIAVKTTEEEAQKEWSIQFRNSATASALNHLLIAARKVKHNKLLNKAHYDLIWSIMEQTSTAPKRIKGQLPAGTVVAHKTGTSGKKQNLIAATNDIGIITLPNGSEVFISILVSNSTESMETNESIIASVSKLAYDYFVKASGNTIH